MAWIGASSSNLRAVGKDTLDQDPLILIQHVLEHFQGWGIHTFSG